MSHSNDPKRCLAKQVMRMASKWSSSQGISMAPSYSHSSSSATLSMRSAISGMVKKLMGITNLLRRGPTRTAMNPLGTCSPESHPLPPSDNSPASRDSSPDEHWEGLVLCIEFWWQSWCFTFLAVGSTHAIASMREPGIRKTSFGRNKVASFMAVSVCVLDALVS